MTGTVGKGLRHAPAQPGFVHGLAQVAPGSRRHRVDVTRSGGHVRLITWSRHNAKLVKQIGDGPMVRSQQRERCSSLLVYVGREELCQRPSHRLSDAFARLPSSHLVVWPGSFDDDTLCPSGQGRQHRLTEGQASARERRVRGREILIVHIPDDATQPHTPTAPRPHLDHTPNERHQPHEQPIVYTVRGWHARR